MLPRHFVVITDDDFIYSVFSYMSPLSLCRLEQVNVELRITVQRYRSHVFNIQQHLLRFFSTPDEFRKLQAETAAYISGSNALQFLSQRIFPLSDLDLYVRLGRHERISEWLTEKEGYVVTSPSPHRRFYNESQGICDVIQLEKTRRDGTNACVQIVVCVCCPIDVILSFHSSKLLVNGFLLHD